MMNNGESVPIDAAATGCIGVPAGCIGVPAGCIGVPAECGCPTDSGGDALATVAVPCTAYRDHDPPQLCPSCCMPIMLW